MSPVEWVPVAFSLLLGLRGVGFVVWKLLQLLKEDTGTEQMREISSAVQEGASAFLNKEYMYLGVYIKKKDTDDNSRLPGDISAG